MGIVYLYFILAACVGIMAMIRGRSALRWFLLGVFATPLLSGLIIVALPPVEPDLALQQERNRSQRTVGLVRSYFSMDRSRPRETPINIAQFGVVNQEGSAGEVHPASTPSPLQFFNVGASMLAALIVVLAAVNYLSNASAGVPKLPIAPLVLAAVIWLAGRFCVYFL